MQAVLLAGGRGTRLSPFSNILPKPLFPIGEQSLAEILVKQLRNAGVSEIIMCLGYLSQLISNYFGDGGKFGVKIRYSYESVPLGTAGPLGNVTGLAEDFLVVNADEFTNLDFKALYDHHCTAAAAMTVAVHNKQIAHNFGVLKLKAGRVHGYQEKPVLDFWVSMGIYAMSKRVVELIPKQAKFDIPDLVQVLLNRQEHISAYVSNDLWIDIGSLGDLRKAQEMAPVLEHE